MVRERWKTGANVVKYKTRGHALSLHCVATHYFAPKRNALIRIKGFIVKLYQIIMAAALAFSAAAPASAIEILTNHVTGTVAHAGSQPDLVAMPSAVMLTSSISSELPEPEVFAMMLLGLVLIGYRARRDSSEKFK